MTNEQAQMAVTQEIGLDVNHIRYEIQEALSTLRSLETTYDMYVRGNAADAISSETFEEMRSTLLNFWEAIKQDEKDAKNDTA